MNKNWFGKIAKTIPSGKDDFFTLNEISSLVNNDKVKALKVFAGSFETKPAYAIINKISALESANRGEIVINPMDIKDLPDVQKAVYYDPHKLNKANPSIFLDEPWFTTLTDYPDTTRPVKANHFLKSDFSKALKEFYQNVVEMPNKEKFVEQLKNVSLVDKQLFPDSTSLRRSV